MAQADQVQVSQFASWDNTVNVDLDWSVDVSKFLTIDGSIEITGSVDADALSQATLDDKQIIDGNSVEFEDYQNTQADNLGIESEPEVGTSLAHAATYTNTVSAGGDTLANASGNIGLNMAAGDYNLQENAAVISSAESLDGSGAAEAGSFSLQNLYDNGFNDSSFDLQNTEITNTVSIGGGLANGADGNIGVNGAAGAFNIQKNALVIATVTGGNLAEATAGTMQDLEENTSYHETTANDVGIGSSLIGASGNIGVNLAAGVGNLQLNSLTIANALAPIAGGTGPGGDTGPGGSTGTGNP
jgi:hypothetical protein